MVINCKRTESVMHNGHRLTTTTDTRQLRAQTKDIQFAQVNVLFLLPQHFVTHLFCVVLLGIVIVLIQTPLQINQIELNKISDEK